MTDHNSDFDHHYDRAKWWLEQSGLETNAGSDENYLAIAQLHATLALAAATANNHPRCGVHCAATGC